MPGEYRSVPFRWILPAIQIVLAIFCYWPGRHYIAWQIRASMAEYEGKPSPPFEFSASRPQGAYIDRVGVVDADLLFKLSAFPFLGLDPRTEGWRYWAPLVLNLPAGALSVPYAAFSRDKTEWTPRGMSRWYWRPICWPTVGLLFWWLAGRGLEALLAAVRKEVKPVLGAVGIASGVYCMLIGFVSALMYVCFPEPGAGPEAPSRGLMLFSGIVWILLGATTVYAFLMQRRIGRRRAEPGLTAAPA